MRFERPTVPRLRPGLPDDDNRDYLPESLKLSDIVVNENGNNSQPYPPGLQEVHGVVPGGESGTWYVYVPDTYEPDAAAPLVISLHGGLMTGWGQAVYSSWTNVADREGLIVVFPDASARRFWTIEIGPERRREITTPNPAGMYLNDPPEDAAANRDLRFLRGLIEWAMSAYHIDRERIFMQGMSMGDAMTSMFARYFGDVLAAAAGSGAPTEPALLFDVDGEVLNRAGPVPIWQSRLDLDNGASYYTDDIPAAVIANREYWLRVNEARELPQIAVRGVDNFAFYSGEQADVVFRDVWNRDHGQTFDDAELVWDYLFSGVRRRPDGSIERGRSDLPRRGDRFAVAVSEGRALAWVSGERRRLSVAPFLWSSLQYHGRGGDAEIRGTYLYVPLDFVAAAFGASLREGQGGAIADLALPDGRELQFARGNIGCVLDGRITSMLAEAVLREDRLCISLEWFATDVMDLRATTHHGVLYITDHHARLSANMALLIDGLLADEEQK